jgi:hypothetical protein
MQEKLCSRQLEYLIPLSLNITSFNISNHEDLIIGNDLAMSVQQAVSNFNMRTSPEPGLLTAYQRLGKWFQPSINNLDDLVRNIEFVLYEMGPRENSVTSDRLAVLANVCDLPYTLNTTALNSLVFSHRTCILVLTFANVWPDAEVRKGKYRRWAISEMGEPVGEATPDKILDEFIHRPKIGMGLRWIRYNLGAKDEL